MENVSANVRTIEPEGKDSSFQGEFIVLAFVTSGLCALKENRFKETSILTINPLTLNVYQNTQGMHFSVRGKCLYQYCN